MSKEFFKKFTEDTNVKLELYEDYLTKWLPVFISTPRPFKNTVNIMDLFCGPGQDIEGTLGSPLIALKVLKKYEGHVHNTSVEINLYFNDYEKDHIEQLRQNIEQFGYNKRKINIHYSCRDFTDYYQDLQSLTRNSANLIFLDQFGIKYIDQQRFTEIIQFPVTDLIFFISSTTFKRFHNDENINAILKLTSEQIQNEDFYKIHRLVHKAYSNFIPDNHSYGLAPFSIKKGSNVYGLIFGSGHPLGLEKFLDICWEKDEVTGEANFDIQGDVRLQSMPSLFAEEESKTFKIPQFQSLLQAAILNGELINDRQIYIFALNHGFTNKHIVPVVENLKKGKLINVKHPSFKCGTVWDRRRTPREIEIL
ncbi:MAG: three-Cys-motif partner protein TcmP [Saprospiraceae bacterium]|nr:three-Cys-motif partner protein TcmP [Saprospiraceae bacterium]